MSVFQAASFVQQVVLSYQEQTKPNHHFDLNFTSENVQVTADEKVLFHVLCKLLDLVQLESGDGIRLSVSLEPIKSHICFTFYNPVYIPRSQIVELLFIQEQWKDAESISLQQLVQHHLRGEIIVASSALIGTVLILQLPKTINE